MGNLKKYLEAVGTITNTQMIEKIIDLYKTGNYSIDNGIMTHKGTGERVSAIQYGFNNKQFNLILYEANQKLKEWKKLEKAGKLKFNTRTKRYMK